MHWTCAFLFDEYLPVFTLIWVWCRLVQIENCSKSTSQKGNLTLLCTGGPIDIFGGSTLMVHDTEADAVTREPYMAGNKLAVKNA